MGTQVFMPVLVGTVLVEALVSIVAHGQTSESAWRDSSSFVLSDDGRGMVFPPELSQRFRNAETRPWSRRMLHGVLESKFGMIVNDGEVVGLVPSEFEGIRHLAFGCMVCHSGKAAGVFIPGLGSKSFDVHEGGRILADYLERHEVGETIAGHSRDFAAIVGDAGLSNRVRGIVNDSLVWRRIAPEIDGSGLPDAFVKIPAVWGFAAKTEAGYFCDGMGRGIGWFGAVPWSAGVRAESILDQVDLLHEMERVFLSFEAPEYPFDVSAALARRGASVFAENCRSCHGDYRRDGSGGRSYQTPRWIPLEVVGTDSARLRFPGGFDEAIDRNPLGGLLAKIRRAPGYLAPRLEGVWARFPYLHNGSVPNLAALLTAPGDRPASFSVKDAGERHRFDERMVGLTPSALRGAPARRVLAGAGIGDRTLYRTTDPGHSNEGHPFGTELPAEEKFALIEYLKTL